MKRFTPVALLTVPFCWPTSASADLLIQYSIGGNPFQNICSVPSGEQSECRGSISLGNGLAANASAISNSPGMAGNASILISDLVIQNQGSEEIQNILFRFGDTGFTAPLAAQQNVSRNIGATAQPTNLSSSFNVSLSYTGCIGFDATLQSVCSGTPPNDFVAAPPISGSFMGSMPENIIPLISDSTPLPPLGGSGSYTLAAEMTLSLSPASELVLVTKSSLTVPAPQLSFLPVLGWALVAGLNWFSRRKDRVFSPPSGCTLASPFFARLTRSWPWVKST
jgi:hypothetical protein